MTAIPGGKSAVTPYVAVKGAARFLDLVQETFRTGPAMRVLNEDGTIGHAEARIGGSVILTFDDRPEWPDTPAFLSVYVDDADTVVDRASSAGATVVTEVATSRIVGDRGGRVRDPLGNIWWIRPTWRTSTRPPCGSGSPNRRSSPSCAGSSSPSTPRWRGGGPHPAAVPGGTVAPVGRFAVRHRPVCDQRMFKPSCPGSRRQPGKGTGTAGGGTGR
ncbi:MAG TPA: VOC family protein [Actinoplanes sp.]|jgi:uncharacterized glyoxalase superfamily protein PhnB